MARFNFFFLWLSNSLLSYHLFTVFAYYIFCFLFLLVCLTSTRAEVLFDSLLYFHLTARRFLQNLPLHWDERALLTGQRGQEWSALRFCGDKCLWYYRGRGGFFFFFWSKSPTPGLSSLNSVQSLSCVRLFATPWPAVCQASLSITNSLSYLKLMSIESVMPSNHLILYRPLLLLPSIFPSIRVFSSESVLHIRWAKYWSFSFSISPSNEYLELISFRMDWFDLLAVQGTLKSLLQHHSSKASILWCSAFFMVHLSHPYMTTRKTIALTRRTFVSKVMSLLFNMLSRLVIAFFPRGKHLWISWLQSPSAVIFEPKKEPCFLEQV